jgi:hypothetical protein
MDGLRSRHARLADEAKFARDCIERSESDPELVQFFVALHTDIFKEACEVFRKIGRKRDR